VKAEDRAQGQDPSLPDHVLASTAIPFPFGQADDGTKRFITSLGMMQEPSVNLAGQVLGGDLRGAGYDLLGMLNPMLKVPLEATTGQSFFRHGSANDELTPNVGQALADLGVRAGLRNADQGPVRYPGSNAVEAALQLSPLARAASSLRTATDTRKGPAEKALNLLSGIKVSDISPKSQSYTLARRASELAKAAGAKTRQDVYFSRQQLEELRKSDPELAAKQEALQALMNQLSGKSKGSKAGKKTAKENGKGEFRLSGIRAKSK
jgi:hypothetical protein